jgi:hypothetical protein
VKRTAARRQTTPFAPTWTEKEGLNSEDRKSASRRRAVGGACGAAGRKRIEMTEGREERLGGRRLKLIVKCDGRVPAGRKERRHLRMRKACARIALFLRLRLAVPAVSRRLALLNDSYGRRRRANINRAPDAAQLRIQQSCGRKRGHSQDYHSLRGTHHPDSSKQRT